MKNVSKYIAILLAFTALTTIYLTGCGKKTEDTEPETTVISEEISEADMIIKQGEDGNLYAYYNDTVVDSYTGVLQEPTSGTWYYVKDGKVDLTYTGFASNSEGEWYIKDGMVDFSYNGETEESATNADGSATTDKVVVENGKVVKKNGEAVTAPATTTKITVSKVVEVEQTKKDTSSGKANTTAGTTKASTAGTTKSSASANTSAKQNNTEATKASATAKQTTTTTTKAAPKTTTTKATTQAANITQSDVDSFIASIKSYAESKGYYWASKSTIGQYGGFGVVETKEELKEAERHYKETIASFPQYEPDVEGVYCWAEKSGNGYDIQFGRAY